MTKENILQTNNSQFRYTREQVIYANIIEQLGMVTEDSTAY